VSLTCHTEAELLERIIIRALKLKFRVEGQVLMTGRDVGRGEVKITSLREQIPR